MKFLAKHTQSPIHFAVSSSSWQSFRSADQIRSGFSCSIFSMAACLATLLWIYRCRYSFVIIFNVDVLLSLSLSLNTFLFFFLRFFCISPRFKISLHSRFLFRRSMIVVDLWQANVTSNGKRYQRATCFWKPSSISCWINFKIHEKNEDSLAREIAGPCYPISWFATILNAELTHSCYT